MEIKLGSEPKILSTTMEINFNVQDMGVSNTPRNQLGMAIDLGTNTELRRRMNISNDSNSLLNINIFAIRRLPGGCSMKYRTKYYRSPFPFSVYFGVTQTAGSAIAHYNRCKQRRLLMKQFSPFTSSAKQN